MAQVVAFKDPCFSQRAAAGHNSSSHLLRQSANKSHCRPSSLPRGVGVQCSGSGFGASNRKKVATDTGVYVSLGGKKKRVNIKEELSEAPPAPVKAPSTPGKWTDIGSLSMFEEGRVTKSVLLENGKALMLYNVGGTIFCSDANSTAYQFPLSDATVLSLETGPAVEVPLDGTTYDLTTGKVLKWCPKDSGNLMRGLLHTLKRDQNPIDLKVYEVETTSNGSIRAKL